MARPVCLTDETYLQPKGSGIVYEDHMNKMGGSSGKVERRLCFKDLDFHLTLLLSTYVMVIRFLKISGPQFCHTENGDYDTSARTAGRLKEKGIDKGPSKRMYHHHHHH